VFPSLAICTLISDPSLLTQVQRQLNHKRYTVTNYQTATDLINFLQHNWHQVDCLVLECNDELTNVVEALHHIDLLIPAIIIEASLKRSALPPPGKVKRTLPDVGAETGSEVEFSEVSGVQSSVRSTTESAFPRPYNLDRYAYYHEAEVVLETNELLTLPEVLPLAINRFLNFPIEKSANATTDATAANATVAGTASQPHLSHSNAQLEAKQSLLADKLKERLGYLGVYYKRNPQRFLRNLTSTEANQLLAQLQALYQDIVFGYFRKDTSVNPEIDEFVNLAFFADVSVTYVVEIHMHLMDEFSKQLQLEGRSEEILLDYRLTLIDVIAHLCEMYRRSVPRES